MATASTDGTVRVWSTQDCSLLHKLIATVPRKPLPDVFRAPKTRREFPFYAAAFSKNGRQLAAFSETRSGMSQLTVWDVETGQLDTEITGSSYSVSMPIFGMAFSPDDSSVVCTNDRYVYHWNLKSKNAVARWLNDYHPQGYPFFAKEQKPYVLSGIEGIFVMDGNTGLTVRSHRGRDLVWARLLSSGRAVTRTRDGHIQLLEARTMDVVNQFTPKTGAAVASVVMGNEKEIILLTSGGQFEQWNLAEGSYLGRLEVGLGSHRLKDGKIVLSNEPPENQTVVQTQQPDLFRRDRGVVTFGLAGARRLQHHSHPTPLLASTNGKLICYVTASQFSIIPAEWKKADE